MNRRRIDPMPWLSLRAQRWCGRRTYSDEPGLEALLSLKERTGQRVSVGIPARNEASTIGPICAVIRDRLMRKAPLVDELLVLDGGSTDDTAGMATRAGAAVVPVAKLLEEIPSPGGKGDSLWRSLAVLSGDIIVWVDADIRNFHPRFVTRLVAPLLASDEIAFVKGFYRRPLEVAGRLQPEGGGRVTELTARPLLNLMFPELAGFIQPLAGEYAGRRSVLEGVPFFTGYGVEVGLLIDLLEVVGLDALAQADLVERVHRNRPLAELTPMAYAIAQVILRRAEEQGRIVAGLDYRNHPLLAVGGSGVEPVGIGEIERPPMADLVHRYERRGRARAIGRLP